LKFFAELFTFGVDKQHVFSKPYGWREFMYSQRQRGPAPARASVSDILKNFEILYRIAHGWG